MSKRFRFTLSIDGDDRFLNIIINGKRILGVIAMSGTNAEVFYHTWDPSNVKRNAYQHLQWLSEDADNTRTYE